MEETNADTHPQGYHSVTPYLVVTGAARALDWYRQTFGAREVMRLAGPNGTIGHAEMEIADSRVMLADECPEMEAHSPGRYGGSPVTLVLYVADVDAVVDTALAAGATLVRAVEDKFFGDRVGHDPRPVRAYLAPCDTHRGRLSRGNRAAGKSDALAGLSDDGLSRPARRAVPRGPAHRPGRCADGSKAGRRRADPMRRSLSSLPALSAGVIL